MKHLLLRRVSCAAACTAAALSWPAQALSEPQERDAGVPEAAGPVLLSPREPGLREDVAWLVDRRVLRLPVGTWPLPSSLLRSALSEVHRSGLQAADADALERVERALRRSQASGSASLQVNTARHPSLDGETVARGAAEATAGLRQHGESWSVNLKVAYTADDLARNPTNFALAGSYAALEIPGAVLSLGMVDRWWGPGRFESSILSTAAPPFPALTLRRSHDDAPETSWLQWIGRWGYEFSLGQLQYYHPAATRTISMRVYTQFSPGVEFALSRNVEWGGHGQPHGIGAFSDALFTNHTNPKPGSGQKDPSNELAGFDVRLSHFDAGGKAWVGHMQILGEDEEGRLPAKFIGTIGAQLKHDWGKGRLEWSAEGTDTVLRRLFNIPSHKPEDLTQPAYIHGTYVDGLYHQGLPLGATIGGGGRIYQLGLDWVPPCEGGCRRYHAAAFNARVSETGAETINANFGVPGTVNGLTLRMDETRRALDWYVGLSLQHYSAGPRRDAGLQFGLTLPFER